MRRPLLLLPRPIDQFVLGDHARELVETAGGAVALPGRLPYGALTRAPSAVRGSVASSIAWGLARQIPTDWSANDTVLIAYHAIQWPAVASLMARGVAEEVWYCRWDRYEEAHDAGRLHSLLREWHERLAEVSELTFAVSGRLADLEREAGRDAITVGLSADDFPSGPLAPGGHGAKLIEGAQADRPQVAMVDASVVDQASHTDRPVAVSLGHLGRRTDWRWLRGAVERLPDLQLLLIGAWHEDEVGQDDDYQWLRRAPEVAWLGPLDDRDAAAVIAQADVGLVPFLVDPFNDCGLPTRILKYARLGRATIAPPLAGCRTWERATSFAAETEDLASALRQAAGRRHAPDLELREWALAQTAAAMNAPLHARLQAE
ncbi:MAG: glycosyltransferase [Patulibacter minatonensis]